MSVQDLEVFRDLDVSWLMLDTPQKREEFLGLLLGERLGIIGLNDPDSPFKGIDLCELTAVEDAKDLPKQVQWELAMAATAGGFSLRQYCKFLATQADLLVARLAV